MNLPNTGPIPNNKKNKKNKYEKKYERKIGTRIWVRIPGIGCYNLPTSQKFHPRNFDKREMNLKEIGTIWKRRNNRKRSIIQEN